MGRELQKKKNRSSIPKVKRRQKPKRVNPLGNAVIAQNWDRSQTLSQNYRRLGLAAKLNAPTGGIEKHKPDSSKATSDVFAIKNASINSLVPTEAKVERDPETGKILRVLHDKKKPNPLNDLLMSDDEEQDDSQDESEVVKQLKEQASRVAEKKPRVQSTREQEWCQRLVEKHGDDYKAMARDMKLNPNQQTAKDISRRINKWKSSTAVAV